ncbi:SRPBCC family protein [Actinokineospora guangxiensis]|uniref:SRPBCC family protein n=1 Tax=Actinokineospora guangxiensis TaxID=1490288 RepID=A0ABW0EET2_9PSEU
MRLEHEFRVPAPLAEVWAAVLDPQRVAPCMPGATLTGVDGDTFTGTVKVKLGPISLTYKGKGEFVERDEAARRVVIKASGKDSQGNGTASAAVTLTLSEDGGETVGKVDTDLSITGKPAQFGRGLIGEVGGKILDSFAGCLSRKLTAPPDEPPAPREPVEDAPGGPPAARAAPGAGAGNASAADPAGDTPAATDPPAGNGAAAGRSGPGQGSGGTGAGAAARKLAAAPEPRPEPEAEPIDLMELAGTSVAKRAVPVAVLLAVLGVVVAVVRRRRG